MNLLLTLKIEIGWAARPRIDDRRKTPRKIVDGQREHSLAFQRTSRNPMFQRHAFQEFHCDKRAAIVFADFMNCADTGMVQSGSSVRLALEAHQRLRVLDNVIRKKFQSNKASELQVLGFIDDAHSASAQLVYDAIVRNGLADH